MNRETADAPDEGLLPATGMLAALGARIPIVAAPMAGGPSTPALVVAAAAAGGLGFLAGGYQTTVALRDQIQQVRAGADRFGVNLFVPNPVPVDPDAYVAYAETLRESGAAYGIDPRTVDLTEDDDDWPAKVSLLLADPVPVVSFTLGIPPAEVVERFHRVGTLTAQTVTNVAEARAAAHVGVDALVVQSAAAGGHYGTTTPDAAPLEVALTDLVPQIRAAAELPVWAAGGLGTPADVRGALAAGAEAAVVGTILLRSAESGASPPYKAALADPGRTETVLTRAFSGRPARALRNRFVDEFSRVAPAGYPAIHHLTSALRKAAAAAGDPEVINIWAGAGFRHATEEPAADIIRRLARRA